MNATLWQFDQSVQTLGIIENETNEAYHAGAGLSFSGLKQFRKTPAHYIAYRMRDDEETSSQRLGTLAHMAILEPQRFATAVIRNDLNRNTNAFKDAAAAAETVGAILCKTSEYEAVSRMRDGVLKNPIVQKLLAGGRAEQSLRWRDPETGVLLKCRPDYLRPDGVVVDVKTFDDLSQSNLERQIAKMSYDWQSHFYLMGVRQALKVETNIFAHLFVDTKAFVARVVVLDDASLELAAREITPLIASYAECLKANRWPGYPEEILTVSLPAYRWREV